MTIKRQREMLLKTLLKCGAASADEQKLEEIRSSSLRNAIELGEGAALYRRSIFAREGMLFCVARLDGVKQVCIFSQDTIPNDAGSRSFSVNGWQGVQLPFTWSSYQFLKHYLPFMAPVSLRNKQTTFGCGDRLGLATPGHLRAIRQHDIYPVLAQQSIRELNLAGRTYRDVVSDAAFLVLQEGYDGGYGADGDHIKHLEDIRTAVAAEMPMITLDLTEKLKPEAGEWDSEEISQRYTELPDSCRDIIEAEYTGKTFTIQDEQITISELEAKRCALIYWEAVEYTEEVDAYLRSARGDAYDLEVSIDETTTPTIPSHHVFIAAELNRRNITVNSLAPRFIGEFQKGVDYIGDLKAFEADFAVHSKIAKTFGGYKVSIHSGSDKFSVYPIIGKHTDMKVHVKTAGTSWLEAVHAVSFLDPGLFKRIVEKARIYAEEGLKQYHITADFSQVPDTEGKDDDELQQFLEMPESRQMIHISFGPLLADPEVREPFFTLLNRCEEYHYDCIEKHIAQHVNALQAWKPDVQRQRAGEESIGNTDQG